MDTQTDCLRSAQSTQQLMGALRDHEMVFHHLQVMTKALGHTDHYHRGTRTLGRPAAPARARHCATSCLEE